ncbi:hypothetical protein K2P47_03150 [Patescibacteria group bacterium]|nr:hypothetical protein [Patescibacteria group bacterium]
MSAFLLLLTIGAQFTFLEFLLPRIAQAAVVTIDATVSLTATEHLFAGSQTVFTTDQIGYKFYVDSSGVCAYSKTTDGGNSWGGAVTVDSKTDCTSIAVWYDRWTPGDAGNNIHISTMNVANATDVIWYNRLDTSSDTLLSGTTPINTVSNSAQVPTYVAGTNEQTISKSTTGVLYIAASDASDSFVIQCSTGCNTTTNWTQAGTNFMDLDNDWNLLMPILGGNMLLINRDISADDIRTRVWNGSTWSGSWTAVDSAAVEGATYDIAMAATQDHSSGDIYLAYAADNDSYTVLDHDVRTAKYVSGSWTSTANIFTNSTRGLTGIAISLDTNLGVIYVAYGLRTTPATATTGNIYYSTSTSAMSSWSAEQGPVNTTPGDLYGIDMNIMSDERIYATWQDPAPDDIFGETIANIAPVTKVSTLGTPATSVSASTSNFYTGGAFLIKESQVSRNVTDITISENGTVDGSGAIKNIKLFYDLDTSAPYDCVSETYSGLETQFGSTDVNGFTGADGVSSFNGLVNITPTQAMCVYTVVDVLDAALSASTLRVFIDNPGSDVLVSGGGLVTPDTPVAFVSGTTINNDTLTQTHYHWRNDNGNETAATSATGGIADTPIPALLQNTPRRLRVQVSNEGSLASPATQFRLEYAEAAPTCAAASGWTDVNATNDAWNMFDSTFVPNGSNTTDISVASGGMVNENTTFLTPNGGQLDTTSQTGPLTLTATNFVELEYSIVASSSAPQGTTYCFRVTSAGTVLPVYSVYPQVTVSADVSVSAIGTQASSAIIPTTNFQVGGTFVFTENVSSRNLTSITITETGSVNGATSLDNIRLRYDLDTTAPYNCASESYAGTETQFGATDTDGFSGPNGSSTFTGSVSLTTTQAVCMYTVFDITSAANNGEDIQIEIANGGNDVVVSAGAVGPTTPVLLAGTTTLSGAILAQTGYHWRTDSGSETTAPSATAGNQNTQLIEHAASSSIRLRLGVSNEGAATSTGAQYQLEYGPKITTCSAVSVWTSVDAANDDWNMFNSVNITDGANTTNIATSTGGVSDGNTTFVTPNGGVKDTSAVTGGITLTSTQFTELEFSITSTGITGSDVVYCFRVTNLGTELNQYDNYAEVRTAPKRDFKVQRGVTNVTGTGVTLTAGVNYTAPQASSSAFVRITNTQMTGAGRNAGGAAQNADDVTAYISNPGNIMTSFTISRPPAAIGNTQVYWEIIEFIGATSTDNEMKVLSAATVGMVSASTSATGTVVTGVTDDTDIVVYITGIENRDIGRNFYYAGAVTAEWDAALNRPVFRRGAGGAIINVSYAVVEYTGINWNIQRVEHTYASSTIIETETITPVNSLARTFIHAQKRINGLGNVNNYGHEVWLSSIGAVSFKLEDAATTPASHTSVVWVIENQQTSAGAMRVQRSNGNTTDGTEPVALSIPIFTPLNTITNASIFGTSRAVGANSNFPIPMAGLSITSTSSYLLWRSEATAALLTYRTEIVEWPINGLAVRQNYYRIYADNNSLLPTDPWPPGPSDLGENTPLSIADQPLGEADRVRLRMSLRVTNANLPVGLYDFKLQYGLRLTSCSAVAGWTDVGAASSSAIWRGYNATGTTNGADLSVNPPIFGDLVLSVSDIAGSYVEENPAPANPFGADPNRDIEYDFQLSHNGAMERSVYCFRMVRGDGTTLDGYLNYPQIRTAGFTPQTQNWRWYDDATNETPTTPLSAETVAPIEIQNDNTLALRVTVGEAKNVRGQNVKFKVQYDENPNFTNPRDVTATSTCTATSTWCYAVGGGADNATITTKVLTDADSCTSSVGEGCGTHNSSGVFVLGDTHEPGANREYAFYLRQVLARTGVVYYFRLYDTLNEVPVVLKSGSVYPSTVAETAKLSLTISGLPSGTTTAGVVTTATSTPSTINFGTIPINTPWYSAHRISVTTNAIDGYRVLSYARQQLLNSYGTAINSVTGTNAAPTSWAVGCQISAPGCIGYHTSDATLAGGSTRFSPLDSYAGLQTTPQEVMYSSLPADDVHDILYRVSVTNSQPAGTYETEIVYLAVPTY